MTPASKPRQPAGVQESPWQVRLARLGVHDVTVDWVDASLPGGTAVWKAENLQLQASVIELPFKQPLQFRASAQLSGGAPGEIRPGWRCAGSYRCRGAGGSLHSRLAAG
jgi:hypothetical protein